MHQDHQLEKGVIDSLLNGSTLKTAVHKVAVLKGGWNAEREVSLTSAKGVVAALRSVGFEVLAYDLTPDIMHLIQTLKAFAPDVVCLNALHGVDVEDGKIQGLMSLLGYPYTGSDPAASAVAFDKDRSRDVFSTHGIPVAPGKTLEVDSFFQQDVFDNLVKDFGAPFIIKPLAEGSSVGVSLIHTMDDFMKAGSKWQFGSLVLVEEYIKGQELSVALIEDQPLGILELRPKNGFYDYEAKYTDGLTEHIMPAAIDVKDALTIMQLASKVVQCLGVHGVSRVDFRYDVSRPENERIFALELNSLPGMTPLSIVPEIAAYHGITYERLCQWMALNPICTPQIGAPQLAQKQGGHAT